jgi:hypothetical protein
MDTPDILDRNRVILCHFDSYSAALLFARYGSSVLAPTPLPEAASDMPAPDEAGEQHAPAAVLDALAAKYGLDAAQLKIDDDFDAWLSSASGPIRIHLARFTTFEAPGEAIAPLGGTFKPISQMRGGMPTAELNLMRQVFNLIMGG